MSFELTMVCVKAQNCAYLSHNTQGYLVGRAHDASYLHNYRFDGKAPKDTSLADWVEIDKIPKKVEKVIQESSVIINYKLKDGYAVSDKTPNILPADYFVNIFDDAAINEEREKRAIYGLYEEVRQTIPEHLKETSFKVVVLDYIADFTPIKVEFDLRYDFIDRLKFHPVLLPTKECKMSLKDSYEVIRSYVKANINPKVARITSDYDFCFSVKKLVPLHEKEPYRIDTSKPRSRNKTSRTEYRTHKELTFYEVSPPHKGAEPYNSYPLVEAFCGKDYKDLKKNIDSFLKQLITSINEPLVDCPNCKGRGVVIDKDLEKK